MSSPTLLIDRSKPLDLTKLMGSNAVGLTLEYEVAQAKALTHLNLSKLRLELVLNVNENNPTQINERLQENLARCKQEGLILLDAKVAEAFLANPALIPPEWTDIADTDAMSDLAGTIRFDGTVFMTPNGQPRVISPFCSRGQWTCGMTDWEQTPHNLALFAKSKGTVRLREYTVVLAP